MAYGQVALSARGPGAALNFPVERVQESLRVLALGGGYGARALPARRRSSTARTGSLSPELYATSTFFPCSKPPQQDIRGLVAFVGGGLGDERRDLLPGEVAALHRSLPLPCGHTVPLPRPAFDPD
jgi:hypothetical protein